MEYKLFDAPKLKMTDDGHGFIAGYASTFANFDSVGERVVKGAFLNSLATFLQDGFIAVGHDWRALPIATPLEANEDDTGLFVRGEFHSTHDAQEARTVIKERLARGKSVKLSIGYEVLTDERVEQGRLLKELELYEWSYVPVPANRRAGVTDAKHWLVPDAMPMIDYSDAVLAMVKEFDRRISDIKEMRAKQGRVLSEANRKRIGSLLEALTAVADDLTTLLAETEPKADPKAARALFAEFQRLEARFNGVVI